jgi:CDP-glycerol glycerophosphotransferase
MLSAAAAMPEVSSSAAGALYRRPVISVIVPVWNVEPYLRECLDSIIGQTIGLDRLEVIAVDDGSTDRSGAILDEYAARHRQVLVVHEPNSGGPGRPRNVGLDIATGTYVFFVDADDYLGPEALARLVAMAERNRSDVVLGRMVAVGDRLMPTAAFRRTLDRAALADVYGTLNVLKLFRRDHLERLGLRFEESLAGAEDAPFTAHAYLTARRISVVADYDCYYCRSRPDSQTKRSPRADYVDHLERMERRMLLLAAHRRPGPARDRLMRRHVEDVLRPFRSRWVRLPPGERRRVFDTAGAILGSWDTPIIRRLLPPWLRIRAWCIEHGKEAALEDIVACRLPAAIAAARVEDGRIYLGYPHFRDATRIPDRCFDLTSLVAPQVRLRSALVRGSTLHIAGSAWLTLLGGRTSVALRRWPRGPVYPQEVRVLPTPDLRDREAQYADAGFELDIDLATAADGRPLPYGSWDIELTITAGRVRRVARLRGRPAKASGRGPGRGFEHPPADVPSARGAPARTTRPPSARLEEAPAGFLRLRVGRPTPIERILELVEVPYARVHAILRRRRP